ncbi:isoprenylcysteine carboxylmethyltransferase family protein [Diaphorobacter sp. HDW4A]|uniref:methyltransferase family protein n=1 Tax=Diaphorobacter sp. HDW4A TaxID=2714924 RepID=UPI00140CEF1D|nr:isoprenylcysteine carboxylmethyltransferase family protein [Diaphorobacter sp. HDW4A]QIL83324.1 isoprenylcysteine carboxylmethyltransferase family protein [Diaphorobacter sp. HDW4A]
MAALDLKIPPPLVGIAAAALMYGVAHWFPAAAFALPARVGLATLIAVCGVTIDLSALFAFHRHRTTVNPLAPGKTSAIVSNGVYRFTRNPMYLGMLVLLLAWCVWLGNVAALVGPVLFAAYITRFQILPEERILLAKFGEPYLQYMGRVRRWC